MSGDFSVNNIGGIKFTATKPSAGAPPPTNPSLLSQNSGIDTFQRSNPLGTSGHPVLNIGGVPVTLNPNSLNPSTLNVLKNPPEHYSAFPPFTDVNG
jgi:hypothetical protein